MSVLRRDFVSLSAILMSGAAMLLPIAAQAQDDAAPATSAEDDAPSLETTRDDEGGIIVTARKFVPVGAATASKSSIPLIETPQSVSVISRDQIDLLNFVDVQQAVRYTAGVVGENYGPDLRFDFLTQRGFIPIQYIDGLQAPVSATIANVGIDLFGFEAVDILKGPASVLYGTVPPGGLYNLTSRRPSSQLNGEIQVKYGTDDFKQAAGTVTGALTDGLNARLTALYRDRDGQTDFVTAKRVYVAPTISAELGPDTKVTFLGSYQWDRVEGDTNGFLPAVGVLVPNPVGKVRRGINLGEPDYNFYRRRQWGIGYEATHRFSSELRFTQNLRWNEYREYQQVVYGAGLGADNRTVSRFNFPSSDNVNQFAVDNRLEGNFGTGAIEHVFLAGIDYRNYREASGFAFAPGGTIDLFDPVYSPGTFTAPASLTPFTNQRLKQTGAYLQDQIKFGGFILTLSGRNDWIKVTNYAGATPVSNKQDKFTWRAGATYVTEAGIAPYVSYATSFQPVIGQTADGDAFSPSVGKQWEAGVKFDARGMSDDVKLFATAAVFRIKQSNILTADPRNTDTDPNNNVRPDAQVQTGEVVSKGAEFEIVTRIRQRLSINASYTYTDAKVTKSNTGTAGARLAAQPKHKASLFVDYTHASGFGAGAGVRHLSKSPGVVALPGTFTTAGGVVLPRTFASPAATLVDATLHYDVPGWRLAVNADNLLDKRYAGRCTAEVSCFFAAGRQIIGTVTKKF